MEIRNQLRYLRGRLGYSKKQLSNITGLRQSTISEIENNININTSVKTALLLSKALHVSVEEIFVLVK